MLLLLPGVLRAWPAANAQLVILALTAGGEGAVFGFASVSLAASALLGVGSLAWLLFHAVLVARGTTAHTFFRQLGCERRKPPKPGIVRRPFDAGLRGNFRRTCGRHPLLWLLPTNQGVEGNGIFFDNYGGVDAGDGDAWARYHKSGV